MSIILLPFETTDFHRLIQWIPSEEALMLWSGPFFTYPLDENQLEIYLTSGLQNPPLRKIYKAIDEMSDEVIGHIELNNIDSRNLAGTISKVLVGNPINRGKGYGAQMVRELLAIGFDVMHLHRLSLIVFDFNNPAIKAYKKVGFTIEGHLRDYRKVNNQYWSSYMMSILEDEWMATRQ